MHIDIAICTYNRSALLKKSLESLISIVPPLDVTWNIFLIDNNSNDDTRTTIKSFQNKLPISYILEKKQGLSHARNRAIEEANGDFLIFLDDDIIANKDFLSAYAASFMKWPNAPFYGGRILPHFLSQPPKWLTENLDMINIVYATTDLGEDCFQFPDDRKPFGANFAINMSCIGEIRFNPLLGRIGKGLLAGEESEFLLRIEDSHGAGMYIGSANILHIIPTERLSIKYIWKYYHGQGLTKIMTNGVPDGHTFFKIPIWMFRKLFESIFHCITSFLASDRRRWLLNFKLAAQLVGMIKGCQTQDKKNNGYHRGAA